MQRFVTLLILICAMPLAAADRDLDLLKGLRRLQLFDLAQRYCQRELVLQSNSHEREAQLTIELIRSFALEAMSRPPEQRESLWKSAHQAATDFQRTRANHPQLLLVQVQAALTLLAEGELAQQEAAAANAGPRPMAAAAERLRGAAKAFEAVIDQLDRDIVERRNKTLAANELTVDELVRLQLNARLHLAQAHRTQALCYPADSRDRQALLVATLEAIDTAVSRLDADDELAARMRVLQMICLRESGQLEEAHRVWDLLNRDELPPELRRAGFAEEVRLLIAAGQTQEALQLLDDPKHVALTAAGDPEVDLARLEAALAAADTDNAKERTQWQRTAAALAARIDQMHGRAAGRRADQLVTTLLPPDATGGNIDLLARVADNLYVKQQFEAAVAAYDKAATAANSSSNASREFELRYKAALIEQQQKNFAAAAARFERLAIELKNYPQAAEAHLVACWNKAQQARDDETAADAYVKLLDEHLSRWPQAATADQARVWLGQWHEAHERWSEAFEAFAAVSPTAKDFPAALAGAGRSAREHLAAEKRPSDTADDFVRFFERISQQRDASGQAPTNEARQAALVAAELAMEYVPGGHATAEKTLRSVLAASQRADEAWVSEATSLLIAAIAGQAGRRADAEKLLESLATDSGQLLKLLDRLAATAKRASERTRKDLAALELEVIERLSKQQAKFTPEQQQELERLRAESLAQLGRGQEALQAYAAMAKSLPNHGPVQEAYAELLAQSSDKASREAALARWRQIAAKSPPRSERWCKAKFAIATLQAQLGDPTSAATLSKFLLETPPGLEGVWRERFEKLLKSLPQK